MTDQTFQSVKKMWDVAAFHFVLMGDVKYINDNSGTLKNTQSLQLGVCFPYLELKISYKLQVFIICFLQPEITDYLKDLKIIEMDDDPCDPIPMIYQWWCNRMKGNCDVTANKVGCFWYLQLVLLKVKILRANSFKKCTFSLGSVL